MAQLLLTKDIYSPAVSSPLNPSSCYQIPSKPHRPRRIVHRTASTPTAPLSPTQQLLRRKAQVAWRSEVMRHAVRRPTTPSDDCADASALEALTYIHQQQEKQRHRQRSFLGDIKARSPTGKRHPLAAPRRESCPVGGDLGMRVEVHENVEGAEPAEKEPLLSDEVFRVDMGRAIETEPSPQADSDPKRKRPPVGVRVMRRVLLVLVLFSVFVVVPALRVRALYKWHFGL